MTDPGPMGWLVAAQDDSQAFERLWSPVADELRKGVGDLRVGEVLRLDVIWPRDPSDPEAARRSLQFRLDEVDGARLLAVDCVVAEQGVERDWLTRAGWRVTDRPGTYVREFAWPHEIGGAVNTSMGLMIDLWRVPNPTHVRFHAPTYVDGPDAEGSFTSVTDAIEWVRRECVECSEEVNDTERVLVLAVLKSNVRLNVIVDRTANELSLVCVGPILPNDRVDAAEILDAAERCVASGVLALFPHPEGSSVLILLRQILNLEGLTRPQVLSQLSWLEQGCLKLLREFGRSSEG